MQTYNSFNEMVAGQNGSPLVSDMSVFNASFTDETFVQELDANISHMLEIAQNLNRKFASATTEQLQTRVDDLQQRTLEIVSALYNLDEAFMGTLSVAYGRTPADTSRVPKML